MENQWKVFNERLLKKVRFERDGFLIDNGSSSLSGIKSTKKFPFVVLVAVTNISPFHR
jgi:hypothetical protein